MKGFVAVAMSIALLFCLPVVLPTNAQEAVPKPAPLPRELEDYYWSLRSENNYWLTSILMGISLNPSIILKHGLFSPYDEFQWLKFAIEHDAGLLGTGTSRMAAEYLEENVIEPIKKYKAIKMMNGHIVTEDEIKSKYTYLNLSEEKMDRLVLAELLFLYVREYVYFPPNKAPDNNRYEESAKRSRLPAMPNFGLPHVLSFPTETTSMQQGICWQQATALAVLYKMTGYDFALYLVPAAPCNPLVCLWIISPPYPLGGYHGIVLLKDEWGLEAPHMSLEKDSMGNELGGEYLMLDPMYDYLRATTQFGGIMAAPNVETLEEMDALGGVYGFLEPSPYITQMMIMHTIVDIIPLINTKFVGKI